MPRKPKGTKTPPDRDKIVVSWIEKQETDTEPAVPNDRVIEMPTSPDERKRRLEQFRSSGDGRTPRPRT